VGKIQGQNPYMSFRNLNYCNSIMKTLIINLYFVGIGDLNPTSYVVANLTLNLGITA
jgi:hypothetical protein